MPELKFWNHGQDRLHSIERGGAFG
jgi:hypothetical protein